MERSLKSALFSSEFELKAIVGMPIEEAKKYAEDRFYRLRVLEEDSKSLYGDMRKDLNRISVRVENGIVTSIISVG